MRRVLLIWLLLGGVACAQVPPVSEISKLQGKPVEVRIESVPPGARIFDANVYTAGAETGYLGVTPVQLKLNPRADQRFWFVMEGYKATEGKITWQEMSAGKRSLTASLDPVSLPASIRHAYRYQPVLFWGVTLFIAAVIGTVAFLLIRRYRRLNQQVIDAELDNPILIGRTVGDYRVDSLLGEGAFSQVYKVEHTEYHDLFAMKMLKKDFLSADFQTRFHREMEVGRDLQHQNLVRVFAFGEFRGAPYIVMEYLKGRTLDAAMGGRPVPVADALPLFSQICSGLAHAHKKGVIHRDIKPENVMVLDDASLRVMDFGIAKFLDREKITATGAALGTPRYMSPEHLNSTKLDARSDVYSMGVILYEMLCGQPPFSGDDSIAVISGHLTQKPPSLRERAPDVPPELEAIVMKMLSKKPDARYPSMEAVVQEIASLKVRKPAPS